MLNLSMRRAGYLGYYMGHGTKGSDQKIIFLRRFWKKNMGSQKDCTVGSVAFCGVGTALMPITQNELVNLGW